MNLGSWILRCCDSSCTYHVAAMMLPVDPAAYWDLPVILLLVL